jgi:hypothetical protein
MRRVMADLVRINERNENINIQQHRVTDSQQNTLPA